MHGTTFGKDVLLTRLFLRCLTFCYTEMPFCIWIKLSKWKLTHSWTFSKKHFIVDKVICFWSRKLHNYYLNRFTNLDLKIADQEHGLFSPTMVSEYLQEKIILTFNDPSWDFSVCWHLLCIIRWNFIDCCLDN